MSAVLQNLVNQPYKHGFVTDIESDVAEKGLSEETMLVGLVDQVLQYCAHVDTSDINLDRSKPFGGEVLRLLRLRFSPSR